MNTRFSLISPDYATGVFLVLFAGVFWSFVPVGVRMLEEATVWQILVYRSVGVLPLVYALIYYHSNGQVADAIRLCGYPGLLGALGLVAAYAGAIAAVRLTTIANAAFLFATAPFFAALFARVFLGETIRRFTLLALLLAMLGIFIMVHDSFARGNWLGDLLALLSAVGFAVFAISLRANKSGNSLPVVFLGASFSIALGLVMCIATGAGIAIALHDVLLALGLGALVLGVGMVLCAFGARVVPAGELALLCMTEVILAPVWAWVFLQELPALSVIAGGAIVVLAIVINAITGMQQSISA